MTRSIPRREFLASLGALAATRTAGSRFLAAPGAAMFGASSASVAAKPQAESIFEVESLKGLDFVLRNSPTPRKFLIETMPGGVALLDYNNDGLLDIFLVNAGQLRESPGGAISFNRKTPAYWNRLYRQNKDGSFTDVTEQAGLADAGDANYGMGVAVGDYDNDGFSDIYVTNFGKIFCITIMATAHLPTSRPRPESPQAAGPPPRDFSITITTACSISSSRAISIGALKRARPAAWNKRPIARPVIFRRSRTSCTTIAETARLRT